MIYAWNKEPKLNIKHSGSPVGSRALSGVVLVSDHGVGKCYIKFDLYTVEKIGLKMPYGIGPHNTAYLKVVKKHGHYDVLCCYTDKTKTVALWRSDKLPEWTKKVHYPETA